MTRRTRGLAILQAELEAGRVGAIMGAGRAGTGGAPSGGGRSHPPHGRAAADWLRQHGVDPPESPHRPPNGATPARSTLTDQNCRPERPGAPTGGLDRRALAALAASEAIPPAPAHPARRWLAARARWRPTVDLPPWLRWLPAEARGRRGTTRPDDGSLKNARRGQFAPQPGVFSRAARVATHNDPLPPDSAGPA